MGGGPLYYFAPGPGLADDGPVNIFIPKFPTRNIHTFDTNVNNNAFKLILCNVDGHLTVCQFLNTRISLSVTKLCLLKNFSTETLNCTQH